MFEFLQYNILYGCHNWCITGEHLGYQIDLRRRKKIQDCSHRTFSQEVRPKDMVGRLAQGFNLDSSPTEHIWDFLEQWTELKPHSKTARRSTVKVLVPHTGCTQRSLLLSCFIGTGEISGENKNGTLKVTNGVIPKVFWFSSQTFT